MREGERWRAVVAVVVVVVVGRSSQQEERGSLRVQEERVQSMIVYSNQQEEVNFSLPSSYPPVSYSEPTPPSSHPSPPFSHCSSSLVCSPPVSGSSSLPFLSSSSSSISSLPYTPQLASLNSSSGSPSPSSSSSSSPQDGLPNTRKKRDIGNFKRHSAGMEVCADHKWGYWWEEGCDGVAHCPDAFDEVDCPCDLLVDTDYLCDGYYDCPDLSDERGCAGCGTGEHRCDADKCVGAGQVCDGVANCADGTDEAFCWRLSSTPRQVKGSVSLWSEGYLQVRRGRAWLPVCVPGGADPSPMVTQYCDEVVGTERYNSDAFELEPVDSSLSSSPSSSPSPPQETPGWALYGGEGAQVSVGDRCEGQVIKVTCGAPTCANESLRAKRMLETSSKATKEEEEEKEEERVAKEETTQHKAKRGTENGDENEEEEERIDYNKRGRGKKKTPKRGQEEKENGEEETEEKPRMKMVKRGGRGLKENKKTIPDKARGKTKTKRTALGENKRREEKEEEEEKRAKLRVVGGRDSDPFKWPFIVAILKDGEFSCGGSVVSASVILTAAHCIGGNPSALYDVQAGMLRRNSWSPYEQSRRVAQITPHPDNSGLENDVALLVLAKPLQLNRWVRPVCLAEHLYPQEDQMCTVAGWGTLAEGGETAVTLQEVEVPVLATCLGDTYLGDQQVLCAGHPLGQKDACQGDSGGPLMCTGEEEGWVQAGIVSFGEGCARVGHAGVYSRVTYYRPWITGDTSGVQGRTKGVAPKQVCGGITCKLTEGTCLPPENMCDGKVDCLGAEDEMDCLESEYQLGEGRGNEGRGNEGRDDQDYDDYDYDQEEEEEEEEEGEGTNYRSKSPVQDSRPDTSHSSIPDTIPGPENANSNVPETIPEPETAHGYIPDTIPSPETAHGYIPEIIPSPETAHGYIPETAHNIPDYIPKVSDSKRGHRPRSDPRSGSNMTSTPTATAEGQEACAVRRVTVGEVLQERERTLCTAEEFKCTDVPECVPASSRCDGSPQCVDGTDERACGCVARVEAAGRDDLLCDGHPDCPDLSDEEDCEPCEGEALYYCAPSQQCVKVSQVCDTKRDCIHGEDERDCLALYNKTEVEDEVVEGTLILKQSTTWHTLCLGRLPTDLGTHVCQYIGYSELGGISYIEAPQFTELELEGRAQGAEPRGATHPGTRTEDREGGGDSDDGVVGKGRIRVENSDAGDLSVLKEIWALRGNDTVGGGGEASRQGGGGSDRSDNSDNDSEELLLRKILALRGRGQARASTCKQAVVRCEREACGKAPLYYYDKVTPVAKAGGVPWAACVQVNGRCVCGGTLIEDTWVLTSATCMANVSLDKDIVVVVMGSVQHVGAPTRVLGGHEVEQRVGHMRGIEDTDMLLLRLVSKMERSDYVNKLCLPRSAPVVGVERRCVVAGGSEKDGRESVGLLFTPKGVCAEGHLCPEPLPDQDYCTESWAGLVACQRRVETNPTWEAVGVWVYQRPTGEEGPCLLTQEHPLLTDAHLTELHRVIDEISTPPPSPLATCEGRICATGVCVRPEEECDGILHCPDLSDELPTCPPLVTTCLPANETVLPPGGDPCECPEGRWACLSGACIPLRSVCDGEMDCTGGEDEGDCSCCKVLRAQTPEKICDGKMDCDDQSDETNCICTTNTTTDQRVFRCYRSVPQSCVGRKLVCNGKEDCVEGEDEGKCVTLAPNVTVVEDALGRPTNSTPSGYLLVRLAGTWYTYAYEKWDAYLSHLICLQLGYFIANATEPRELETSGMVINWDGDDGPEVEEVEEGVVEVVWIDCEKEMRDMTRRSVSSLSSLYSSFFSALPRKGRGRGRGREE